MKTVKMTAALAVLVAAVAACTTIGTGTGQLASADTQETPVAFNWTSKDGGMSGTMTAALPEAVFAGRFFQITQQTRGEVLMPLWAHWRQGWYDWPYWSGPMSSAYPTTQFITHYSGKVVATLESANNERMRCRFHLVDPASGMGGGGEGQCQLSDARMVRAVFPGTQR